MELKEALPIVLLIVSIGFNLYQSGKTREHNRDEKDTDAIRTIQTTLTEVKTNVSNLRNDVDNINREVNIQRGNTTELSTLKERIENTKSGLSEIKGQMQNMLSLVQQLVNKHQS